MSFKEFLSKSRSVFNGLARLSPTEIKSANIWVVLGNEAFDLDSQNCSLVMAYYLQSRCVTAQVLPVMNIPREELKLRKDNLHMIEMIGFDPEDLIFIDDFAKSEFKTFGTFTNLSNVALCDHNDLSPRQHFLFESVKYVIDHHTDSGHWKDEKIETIIKPYVSCASVVAEMLLEAAPKILEDSHVRSLLMSAISIDTGCLSDWKVEKPEHVVYHELVKRHDGDAVNVESSFIKLNSTLMSKRLDVSDLSPKDILLKDLKFCCDKDRRFLFAVASVKSKIRKLGLKQPETRLEFMRMLAQMLEEPQLDSDFASLSAFFTFTMKKGPHSRLVVATKNPTVVKEIEEWLKEKPSYLGVKVSGRLEEEKYFAPEEAAKIKSIRFCMFELDRPISRKQVIPLLIDAFSGIPLK